MPSSDLGSVLCQLFSFLFFDENVAFADLIFSVPRSLFHMMFHRPVLTTDDSTHPLTAQVSLALDIKQGFGISSVENIVFYVIVIFAISCH